MVASNPNTPVEVLLSLLEEVPDQVLDNPSLPLHLLAEPRLLDGVSFEGAVAVVDSPSTPAWLIERLASRDAMSFPGSGPRTVGCGNYVAGHRRAQRQRWATVLAYNPATAPERLASLALGDIPSARFGASINPSTPRETLFLLGRAGSAPSLLRPSGHHEAMRDEDRTILLEGGHWGRVLLAAHPDTPRALHERLLREASEAPRTGDHIDDLAALDPAPSIARALLRHPLLSAGDLEALRQHPYYARRRGVGDARWRRDREAERVARSPAAPEARLKSLVERGDPWLRALVASNAATPPALLFQLAADHQVEAIENPSYERAVLEQPELFLRLSRRELWGFTWPDATPYCAIALAEAHGAGVGLPDHPATPASSYLAWMASSDERHRSWVLRQPAVPHALRRLLRRAGRSPTPVLSAAEREVLSASCAWGRELVARNPSTTPPELALLARHRDEPGVLVALAANPATPETVLRSLADDLARGALSLGKAKTSGPRRFQGDAAPLLAAALASSPSLGEDARCRVRPTP